jgi:hypothetical protein
MISLILTDFTCLLFKCAPISLYVATNFKTVRSGNDARSLYEVSKGHPM